MQVLVWTGKFANAIEKSRVSEVAQSIVTSKDLGCKNGKITVIDEESPGVGGRKFWRHLSSQNTDGDPSTLTLAGEAGPPDEDS